jgi:hypothetical protein
MSLKWKLYGVANYVLLIAFIYFGIIHLKVTAERVPPDLDLTPIMPFIISHLVMVPALFLNIIFYHKYFSNKRFTSPTRTFYLVSIILYTLSLTTILISLIYFIIEELSSDDPDAGISPLSLIYTASFLIGLFILVNQFKLWNLIKRRRIR